MAEGRSTISETTPPGHGRGRSVLLIVTGGIAAYKACTIVRRLQEAQVSVRVAMTEAATRFVTPMTFEALSGQKVGTTLWGEGGEEPLDHIDWAQSCDLVLVAPATANFLAKMAHGLADDLASTLLTAATAPVVAAPAMNDQMWKNPANQDNLTTLRSRGVEIIDPGSGYLACGTIAEGRLAEPDEVVERVVRRLDGGPLTGRRVLITAGGTREPIDPVRWVGNHSSGRMGMALARAARDLGAEVTLLLGPTELPAPDRVELRRFVTTEDLRALLAEYGPSADEILMSAAVSDWRPTAPAAQKLKKQEGRPDALELEATPDLLAELSARRRPGQRLVGFALESGGDGIVEEQSRRKLEAKGLDLICGNRADAEDEGFAGEGNRLFLLDREGRAEWTPFASKVELAGRVLERLHSLAPRDDVERAQG